MAKNKEKAGTGRKEQTNPKSGKSKKEMILSIKFPQENRWNSSADNILSEPASS